MKKVGRTAKVRTLAKRQDVTGNDVAVDTTLAVATLTLARLSLAAIEGCQPADLEVLADDVKIGLFYAAGLASKVASPETGEAFLAGMKATDLLLAIGDDVIREEQRTNVVVPPLVAAVEALDVALRGARKKAA